MKASGVSLFVVDGWRSYRSTARCIAGWWWMSTRNEAIAVPLLRWWAGICGRRWNAMSRKERMNDA